MLELLKSNGVVLRYPRLTDEECARAVALYQQGVRQVDIARELGRDKGHVWHVLRRAGAL
jgi:transposase-like protein